MTERNRKNISRRDALKILGAAAGATVLANLPSKWSTPELETGVLPAHAQTSQVSPTVVTVSVNPPVEGDVVNFNGEVTSEGSCSVTVRGFVISANQNPTTSDTVVPGTGSGLGPYTGSSSGFNPGVTYYVRAYVTCALGTFYGNQLTFSLGFF